MGKVYTEAKGLILDKLATTIELHYPDLQESGAKIGITMVEPNRDKDQAPTSPAVKNNKTGWPCVVKIVSTEDRVHSEYDAIIKIDEDDWEDADDKRQIAILDHALAYIKVRRNKGGEIIQHDDLRPALVMNEPDFHLFGFRKVVERNRDSSLETETLKKVAGLSDDQGQMLFAFALGGVAKKSKGAKHGLRAAS